MTPERLEEIRTWINGPGNGPPLGAYELLKEVDRLRRVLATLRADTRQGCSTPCCGCAASIAHAVRDAEPTP